MSKKFALLIHTLLHVDESLSTKAELYRKGEKGTLKVLCGLDAIWISHKYLLFNLDLP